MVCTSDFIFGYKLLFSLISITLHEHVECLMIRENGIQIQNLPVPLFHACSCYAVEQLCQIHTNLFKVLFTMPWIH